MLIEQDARRFIVEALEIEKELFGMENKEKCRGRILFDNEEFYKTRRKLVKIIAKINSVANSEGTGRDDLDGNVIE
jgi:hypothetical protein